MIAAIYSELAKPAHRTAARMLLDTLTLGDGEAFAGLSVVLRARLAPGERKMLAWAALRACDDQEAVEVADAILPSESRAGWPVVTFEDLVEEASFWADMASPDELRAYAGVCLARLPAPEQFLGSARVDRRAA